jgi:HEAT repeat protein
VAKQVVTSLLIFEPDAAEAEAKRGAAAEGENVGENDVTAAASSRCLAALRPPRLARNRRTSAHTHRSIARALLGSAAVAAFGLAGCAGTYDLVTSERFKERPFHTLFTSEDPIQVLEKVQAGDDRVRAMHNLEEPREHGGTAEQQDRVIAILEQSATVDPRPLCRLAAIEALSRFKDPRVGPILLTAYNNSAYDAPAAAIKKDDVSQAAVSGLAIKGAVSQFTPDTVTTIQCLTLKGLGERRTPEGLRLLIQIASAPTDRPKKSGVETAGASLGLDAVSAASEPDRADVRLAAIRALGNYERDSDAAKALVAVLKTDRDVAVRGRTHESLMKITGQDIPPDGQAWANWLDKASLRR